MGKANRQRRQLKEKARRRAAADRGGAPSRGGPAAGAGSSFSGASFWSTPQMAPNLADLAAYEIGTALHALAHRDERGFAAAAARVADGSGQPGWRRTVERVLAARLESTVTRMWQCGWQPADLVRAGGRLASSRQVALLGDAIAAELRNYPADTVDPRWQGQLIELRLTVWWAAERNVLRAWVEEDGAAWSEVCSLALGVLDLLDSLPELERLSLLPGTVRTTPGGGTSTEGTPVDERILSRVRALLAKAESTTFEAEAETFTAGAQALMARYSIDRALLAATGKAGVDEPAARRVGIDNPYERPKVLLLDQVARANRCRTIWTSAFGYVTVVGYPADLDAVELLFTSLLVQATRAMTQQGSRTDRYGRSRTRTFRQSFLTSYGQRIGERLAEATTAEATRAAAEPGGSNLLPVLASREHVVERTLATMFPEMTHRVMTGASDREGWQSGRAAADLASLHTGAELPG